MVLLSSSRLKRACKLATPVNIVQDLKIHIVFSLSLIYLFESSFKQTKKNFDFLKGKQRIKNLNWQKRNEFE